MVIRKIKNLKDVDHWITEWELRGKDYTNKVFTPVEKIVILELPKFKKYKDRTQNQELKNWVESITNPEKEKLEIAKKMKSMNVDIQTIIDATGLTKEEIEKL